MLSEGGLASRHVWKRFRSDRGRHRLVLRDQVEILQRRLRGGPPAGWRWVLVDVDFVVQPGEAVALLGSNGSGKSTLLKVLNGVMFPYAGGVEVVGRVGALIDVRAGIHPDLTGRENIYLYGTLVGFSRRQVALRFDEIVAFAELEHAVDRQIKRYSSGMQMRLGFAIAAFLDPDVLLVDEVLAVGDASFQQKCLDRIGVMLGRGTTLVFVSHDLAAVEATCDRGIWLREGRLAFDGDIRKALSAYREHVEREIEAVGSDGPVQLRKIELRCGPGGTVRTDEPLELVLDLDSAGAFSSVVHVGVSEGTATPVFVIGEPVALAAGQTEVRCRLSRLPLPRGRYFVWVAVTDTSGADLLAWQPACPFDVAGPDLDPVPRSVVRLAPVHVPTSWDVGPGSS